MSFTSRILSCLLLLLVAVVSVNAANKSTAQISVSYTTKPGAPVGGNSNAKLPSPASSAATPAASSATTPAATLATKINVESLKVGEYFRPQGAEVSGYMNATAPYLRSPCPALNSLANHGYLPRNGRGISRAQMRLAVKTVFNVEESLADTMVEKFPDVVMTLADTSVHNIIEHDASFFHADVSYYHDPSVVDMELWQDLAARATNGKLGIKEFGSATSDRIKRCEAKPTGCDFGLSQRKIMIFEAAVVLLCVGEVRGESISVERAKSFFVDERFPSDFKTPEKELTSMTTYWLMAKIQLAAF